MDRLDENAMNVLSALLSALDDEETASEPYEETVVRYTEMAYDYAAARLAESKRRRAEPRPTFICDECGAPATLLGSGSALCDACSANILERLREGVQ